VDTFRLGSGSGVFLCVKKSVGWVCGLDSIGKG